MRLASECSDCVERRDSPLDTLKRRNTLVRFEPDLEDRPEPVRVELNETICGPTGAAVGATSECARERLLGLGEVEVVEVVRRRRWKRWKKWSMTSLTFSRVPWWECTEEGGDESEEDSEGQWCGIGCLGMAGG